MAVEAVRIEGLEGVLKTLKQLPPEIVSRRGGPIRFALRKAAKVILDEAKNNVQKIIDTPNVDGRFVSTGVAKESLRIKRVRPLNGKKGEAAIVAVGSKKYAGRKFVKRDKRKGRSAREKDLATNDVLFMLEHGTERRQPMPWMRPAFDSKRQQALGVFVAEANKKITQIIRKLEQKNGGKR